MGAELSGRRSGFTLVELVVAMTLMATVGLAIGAVTARLVSAAARDSQLVVALDLVNERLARVSGDPAYTELEGRYEGDEATLVGFPGMQRTTEIERVNVELDGGGRVDYKIVEVTVTGPGLNEPVVRTTTVGLQ
ncbi:MAG: type II secretion system protein [Gemmatimonadota bacterium]